MRTAILEISENSHFTFVESIAKIYSAVKENEVVIFTHEKGRKSLQHIENQRVSIITPSANAVNNIEILSEIKNFDLLFVVTLDSLTKNGFRDLKYFQKIDFNCPIYYVIHNVDLWFQQTLNDKCRNLFHKLNNLKDFIYRIKVHFIYANINIKIIEKVKKSNGKFVTLTETVGCELAKHVGENRVAIVPFSVFDGGFLNNSTNLKFRICVPGYVSSVRRDYFSIFKLLENDADGFFKNKIEFDFLGGISPHEGGELIKNEAKKWIEKGFSILIYDKPNVGLEEFDANLAKADLVLGNLHVQLGANRAYGKSKDSGLIFTMIKAAKPGLLPADYPAVAALKTSILVFEKYDDIVYILKNLLNNTNELTDLKQAALKNSQKFTPIQIYNRLMQNEMTENK